jgi:hypothetical protein
MIKDTLVKTSEQLHQLQGHAHPNMFFVILSSIGAFFSPVALVFLATGMFVILDTFTGRWKAKKLEVYSSRKLRQGLFIKTGIYLFAMVALYLLDKGIINQYLMAKTGYEYLFTKLAAVVIALIEIDSMDESVKEVKGIGLFGVLKRIINKIKTVIEEVKSLKDLFSKK